MQGSIFFPCHVQHCTQRVMQVFFDITSGDESAGRVVIGLYAGEPFYILGHRTCYQPHACLALRPEGPCGL